MLGHINIMKTKWHIRQVSDNIVKKFIQSLEHFIDCFLSINKNGNSCTKNGKRTGQLQSYHEIDIHLNWQSWQKEQQKDELLGAHWNFEGAAEFSFSSGDTQLMVMHSTNSPFKIWYGNLF